MTTILAFIELLKATFGPQIVAILGLTLVQVVLAVAVAIKHGTFEWKKLADFFQTLIIPKLLGWLACAILAEFVLADYLPGELGPGIATVAFLALVASYVGAILTNLQDLEIIPAKISGLLTRVGIPATISDATGWKVASADSPVFNIETSKLTPEAMKEMQDAIDKLKHDLPRMFSK